ncbi:MAG: hypothetical protein C0602_03665 [Denitrovibrio sp.]|nr:MAG: hypothetical protein C0602_03665 [Denitrovibrio sp.]
MSRLILIIFLTIGIISTSYAYTIMPAEKTNIIKGYTRAVNTMTITAEVSGRIKEIYADMGHVSKGGVFVVIDPIFTQLNIKSLEAALGKVDASKARLKESVDYYQKDYNRVAELYKSDVATASRRDDALHAFEQAKLSLNELEAERKSLLAQMEELKEKLQRHYIRVPEGWSITSKPLEVGELVSAGQPIATAGDFNKLIVPVFLSNEEMKYLSSKETFPIRLEGEELTAKLSKVNPSFDERTRKREAEILLDKQGLGGMLAEIPVKLKADGYLVSEDALINRYSNPRVKVKSTGQEIRVSVLSREDGMVMIAETPELKPGMELEAAK